jgi:glyoxylase-like metal-dependent hydrolase (beta-lactamase superfamily II)
MSVPDGLGFEGITTGGFLQNCWLLWDRATREAVVVDPGEGSAAILAAVRAHDLAVRAIWLTHAHIDHVLGVTAVREATGAPVWLHPDDRRWYDALPEQGRFFGVSGLEPLAPPDHALHDGQTLSIGPWSFLVRHTPGHAPGHVAFLGHGLAVAGDVLFLDSIGRTDLAGGDHPTLLASIEQVLLPLDDATRVLPGHGPETTIGRERRLNPFLQPR